MKLTGWLNVLRLWKSAPMQSDSREESLHLHSKRARFAHDQRLRLFSRYSGSNCGDWSLPVLKRFNAHVARYVRQAYRTSGVHRAAVAVSTTHIYTTIELAQSSYTSLKNTAVEAHAFNVYGSGRLSQKSYYVTNMQVTHANGNKGTTNGFQRFFKTSSLSPCVSTPQAQT